MSSGVNHEVLAFVEGLILAAAKNAQTTHQGGTTRIVPAHLLTCLPQIGQACIAAGVTYAVGATHHDRDGRYLTVGNDRRALRYADDAALRARVHALGQGTGNREQVCAARNPGEST